MPTKASKSYYVEQYIKKFGNKFDYSNFEYVNSKTPAQIICPVHGPFYVSPHKHLLSKHGCRRCGSKSRWDRDKVTTPDFVKRAHLVHGNVFCYTNTQLSGMENKVIITCKRHGDFNQKAANHLVGDGCPKCRNLKTTVDFIQDSRKIHGKRYFYTQVKYEHNRSNVIITCKKHGDFSQRAGSHLEGKGCPRCRESKGELKIREFLTKGKIKFVSNKMFKDCVNPKTGHQLKFDFYLSEQNALVEYDGKQHFEFIENWQQDKNKFLSGIEKDKIKNEYCKIKNIRLLRIPYTNFKRLENILFSFIQEIKL
jgi:hypothetical protein